jgi:4'-phosphopantetheinyl transferase
MISSSHIHVFSARFSEIKKQENLFLCLSSDEILRSVRLVDKTARDEFVYSRATLRQILAEFYQTTPEKIELVYNAHGRPELAPKHSPKLHFSLSHSGDFLVIAVCEACPLGVDVEAVRAVGNAAAVAKRVFSTDEQAHFLSLSEAKRQRFFFQTWTKKEAVLKARGLSLASLINSETMTKLTQGMTVEILVDAEDHVAALAYEGEGLTIIGKALPKS